jgi:hypothetical protein
MASHTQPDQGAWLAFVPIEASPTTIDCVEHELTQTAASNAWSQPHDNKGCTIGGKPLMDSALLASGVSTLEVRNDDLEFSSSRLIFQAYRNDGRIYDTLMQLAVANGDRTDDGAWTISIGYSDLRKASGCGDRALGRAWPRLLEWGFLRSIEPHTDRQPSKYILRSIACVDAIYRDAGCTHLRVLPGGKFQPFRSAPSIGEVTM